MFWPRSHRYFLSLTLSSFVLFAVTALLVLGVSYSLYRGEFERRAYAAQRERLAGYAEQTELKANKIRSMAVQLAADELIHRWVYGKAENDDLALLSRVLSSIRSLETSTAGVASIDIYNGASGGLISSVLGYRTVSARASYAALPPTGILEFMEAGGKVDLKRTPSGTYEGLTEGLTLFHSIPVHRKLGSVSITFDPQWLLPVNLEDPETVLLIGEDFPVIRSAGGWPSSIDPGSIPATASHPGIWRERADDGTLLHVATGPVLGGRFRLVSIVPRKAAFIYQRDFNPFFGILFLLTFILSVGCSLFVYSVAHRPIHAMAQTIAEHLRGGGPLPETYDEEIVYLSRTFDDMIAKNTAVEKALERSRGFATERALRDLLFGRRRSETLSVPHPHFPVEPRGTYVVAILQLESGGSATTQEPDEEIFQPVLRHFPGVSLRTGMRAITLLIRLGNPQDHRRLVSLLEKVVKIRRNRHDGKATIGVSEPRTGADQISRGYAEALEALRHRALWGDRTVIEAGTTDASPNAGFFSVQEGYELMSALRTLDRHRIESVIERLLEGKSERYSVDLLNTYLLYLASCIAEVAMEYKVEPDTLFGSGIFDVVISHDTIEEKKRYLISRCTKLVEALNNESRRYKRLSLELVLEYIESNYQSPLSLSIIADELHMSPSYLSSLIKKELGINYVAYLNRLRVEKAKALLLAKEWTIKRVGAEAGYDSEHTFIRNFKKYAGLRPSEYRNTHQGKLA